jgi:HEAT repeat protein
MRRRYVLWLAAVLVLAAVAAILIPDSPVYLPNLIVREGQSYDGHSTRYWIKALKSPDLKVRHQAIFALGAIGDPAGEAVPALAALMLEDPDRGIRIDSALALSKMDPASRAAVPELAQALGDSEPWVRMNAAIALSRLRTDSRPAVPALIEALQDKGNDTDLRAFTCTIQEMVALALGRASAGSAEGVPALTAALKSAGTVGMRRSAARALGEVGAPARPAVPDLQALLTDRNGDVRETAEEALKKIGGEAAP